MLESGQRRPQPKMENTIHISNPIPGNMKRIKHPYDKSITYLETLLPFSEANKLVPGNANVRTPKESSRPYKKMMETVRESPESFHDENRGIVFFCQSFHLDNDHLQVNLPTI